jgi:hypothetical protein
MSLVEIFGPALEAAGPGTWLAFALGAPVPGLADAPPADGDDDAPGSGLGVGEGVPALGAGDGETNTAVPGPGKRRVMVSGLDGGLALVEGPGDGDGPGVPSAIETANPASCGSGTAVNFEDRYTAPSSTRCLLCDCAPPPGPAG